MKEPIQFSASYGCQCSRVFWKCKSVIEKLYHNFARLGNEQNKKWTIYIEYFNFDEIYIISPPLPYKNLINIDHRLLQICKDGNSVSWLLAQISHENWTTILWFADFCVKRFDRFAPTKHRDKLERKRQKREEELTMTKLKNRKYNNYV